MSAGGGGRVFFLSDPHWGHKFVATLRGHATTTDHDAWLYDVLASTFKAEDQVWWLGDLAMSNPALALGRIGSLPGRHHLIAGNHDRVHPMHRDAHKHQRAYAQVFESVQAFARRRVGGVEVLLSHFPYETDDGNADHTGYARFSQYRLPDQGRWLLHGHTHLQGQRLHNDHQIHVGLDAWRRPVALDEVASMMGV